MKHYRLSMLICEGNKCVIRTNLSITDIAKNQLLWLNTGGQKPNSVISLPNFALTLSK